MPALAVAVGGLSAVNLTGVVVVLRTGGLAQRVTEAAGDVAAGTLKPTALDRPPER
jgi:hypothetical protein